MKAKNRSRGKVYAVHGLFTLIGATVALFTLAARDSEAGGFKFWPFRQHCNGEGCANADHVASGIQLSGELDGTWYWMRSPEEEKRVVMGLYNRYCIRCHGVDGRGVWDIPGVPDFTNARWQACRSDGQLARATLEGRGACMPPFRGTLTLEEATGMARYLRTFVPGTEVSPPNVGQPKEAAVAPEAPAPRRIQDPIR